MKNYQILPNHYDDMFQGFEIQDSEHTFISWDMPVRQVLKEYRHLLKIETYGVLSFVSFHYTVRIGNMILENFRTQYRKENDPRPFKSYDAHCMNSTQEMQGFPEIHQNLSKLFPKPTDVFYHNQELLRCVFDLSGIHFVLYKQTIEQQGYVLLRWTNDRCYPQLLENTAYEKVRQISAYFTWQKPALSITQNYSENLNIKRNPLVIQEKFGTQTVIWRDDRNQYLGFSKDDKAHIYQIRQISHLSIRQVNDGRIGFYSELNVHIKSEYGKSVSVIRYFGKPGEVVFFATYKKEIEKVTRKKVFTKAV